MASKVYSIFVEVGANSARFRKEMERTRRSARQTGNIAGRALRGIGVGVAASAAAGITALAGLTRQAREAALAAGDVAARLGVSVGALSELQGVAAQSGLAVGTLNMALQRTQRRVSEAAKGTGEAVGALKELNLDARQLAQLPLDQQFDAIANALQGVENAGDRTRLAFKLFDSEGVALLQTLDRTGRTLAEQRQRVRDLGGTITDDQVAALQAARGATEDVRIATEGFGRELAEYFAPAVAETATKFADWIAQLEPAGSLLERLRGLALDAAAGLTELGASAVGAYASFIEFLAPDVLAEPFREAEAAARGVAVNLRDQAAAYRENAVAIQQTAAATRELADAEAAAAVARAAAPTTLDNPDSTASTSAAGAAFSQAGIDAQQAQTEALAAESAKRDELRRYEAEQAAFYINLEAKAFETAQRQKLAALQTYSQLAIAAAGLIFGNDKKVAIATAAINVATGITKALSRNDWAAAALVAVQGAAQIAAIRRAQPGGGSGGGGFSFRPPPSPILEPQAQAGAQDSRGGINIVFNGDVNGWDEYIQERVISGIRDAVDNRDVTIFGRSSRQALELQGAT